MTYADVYARAFLIMSQPHLQLLQRHLQEIYRGQTQARQRSQRLHGFVANTMGYLRMPFLLLLLLAVASKGLAQNYGGFYNSGVTYIKPLEEAPTLVIASQSLPLPGPPSGAGTYPASNGQNRYGGYDSGKTPANYNDDYLLPLPPPPPPPATKAHPAVKGSYYPPPPRPPPLPKSYDGGKPSTGYDPYQPSAGYDASKSSAGKDGYGSYTGYEQRPPADFNAYPPPPPPSRPPPPSSGYSQYHPPTGYGASQSSAGRDEYRSNISYGEQPPAGYDAPKPRPTAYDAGKSTGYDAQKPSGYDAGAPPRSYEPPQPRTKNNPYGGSGGPFGHVPMPSYREQPVTDRRLQSMFSRFYAPKKPADTAEAPFPKDRFYFLDKLLEKSSYDISPRYEPTTTTYSPPVQNKMKSFGKTISSFQKMACKTGLQKSELFSRFTGGC